MNGGAHLVTMLNRLLILALRDRATLRPQSPIAASDVSEPEPDLAIVPNGRYVEDHPPRALWILEVSDSTLHKDRTVKARLYASSALTRLIASALSRIDMCVSGYPRTLAAFA